MITVVISSYKYGHLAAHCVESILSQSIRPHKVLFVDDGVGDCEHIQKYYPNRVEYYKNPENYGTVANFQNMLNKVQTEYCMFIGADNWIRSDAISLFLEKIKLKDPDIITYDMLLTGELKDTRVKFHYDEIKPYQGDYYWTRENKHHGSMLYRTSLAKSVGGYTKNNPDSEYTEEDLSLWKKMTSAGAKITYIKQPLLYYRHHSTNNNKYHYHD